MIIHNQAKKKANNTLNVQQYTNCLTVNEPLDEIEYY